MQILIKVHLIIAVCCFGITCVAARNATKIKETLDRIESLSDKISNYIEDGNLERAFKIYGDIITIYEDRQDDMMEFYGAFYVNSDIHEPVIRYCARNHIDELQEFCDFYCRIESYKIGKWYGEGLVTKEMIVSSWSFLYTKLAHWLSDEGHIDEAESCHAYAIRIFEDHEVIDQPYADELLDMACFQQRQRNNWFAALHYRYRTFEVLEELYGINDDRVVDEFIQMRLIATKLSIGNIDNTGDNTVLGTSSDLYIPDYYTAKELHKYWRSICSELRNRYGEDMFSEFLRKDWEQTYPLIGHLQGKNAVDSLKYGLLPVRSYDVEMVRSYCSEAKFDIINGDLDACVSSLNKASRYSVTADEYVAYIIDQMSIVLQNAGYVDKAMEHLVSGILFLIDEGSRPDLIEYLSAQLSPLSDVYHSPESFQYTLLPIDPLLHGGTIRYYDIENYIAVICSAMQYYGYCYDIDNIQVLSDAAESLLNRNGNEISTGWQAKLALRIADCNVPNLLDNGQKEKVYLRKAIDLQKQYISELQYGSNPSNSIGLLYAYRELSLIYGRSEDYGKAKTILENCLSSIKENDPGNLNMSGIYSDLAWIASRTGSSADYIAYTPDWFVSERKAYVHKSFGMTKDERISYFYNTSLFFINESLAYAALSVPEVAGIAYDANLTIKGFLLNQEKIIAVNTLNSNYAELKNAYEMYREGIVSGSSDVHQYERRFMHYYSLYPEFIESSSFPTWQEVSASLAKDEIAIEFTAGATVDTDAYVALLIKNGWGMPKAIRLADKSVLEKLVEDGSKIYETGSDAYSIIWEKIEPYLKGVKTIYFSPYKALCQINVEVLPDSKGIRMNAMYEMNRLSSTSLICDKERSFDREFDSALLFGGLNYNTDTTYLKTQARELNRTVSTTQFKAIGEQSGFSWNNLPGTKLEVESIRRILETEIDVDLYEAEAGTEDAFKSYSGKCPSILHIATHGFYQPRQGAAHFDMYPDDLEDKSRIGPMQRCGLMFSGGQHAWSGQKIPAGIEDGVLTAVEISGMDLSGADLVVLSACQTGLGDVGGEGVYGLQRGFKLAGAGTIIMSLWKVNDVMTKIMMTSFYSQLIKGKTAREAFDYAQNAVREKDDDPAYWAAFIMLD